MNMKPPRGRVTYPTRFRCELCSVTFETSIGSMVEHAENHIKIRKNNTPEFIRIYSSRSTGAYRPLEHAYNSYTGKLFQGSDSEFAFHVMPVEFLSSSNLACRKGCGHSVKYNADMTAKQLVKAVDKYCRHEMKCKGASNKLKPGD